MPSRLRIKTLEWQNFLSYGDYHNSLDLLNGGPVLILGKSGVDADRANGAGKTTISNAISWCLFGRVPRKASPGDKIINWFTEGNCFVKITTEDGWEITRTRKRNGHDDLLVHKDGTDITLSTTKQAQQFLRRQFNLDYNIFVSSVFCGQFQKPFMEMGNEMRKATMEKLLGLNRLNVWGDVAKEKRMAAEAEQLRLKTGLEIKKNEHTRLVAEIQNTINKSQQFHNAMVATTNQLMDRIKTLDAEIAAAAAEIPNMEELHKEWDEYRSRVAAVDQAAKQVTTIELALRKVDQDVAQAEKLIQQYKIRMGSVETVDLEELERLHKEADEVSEARFQKQSDLEKLRLDLRKLNQDLQRVESIIKEWNDKAGTECPSCKQSVKHEHAEQLCTPYLERQKLLTGGISKLSGKIIDLENEIKSMIVNRPSVDLDKAKRDRQELENLYDLVTAEEAKITTKKSQRDRLVPALEKAKAAKTSLDRQLAVSDIAERVAAGEKLKNKHAGLVAQKVGAEANLRDQSTRPNPYDEVVGNLKAQEADFQKIIKDDNLKVTELDRLINEVEYIRKAYHDRNKIKSLILAGIVPVLNQRIEYYLNSFECDFELKFTSTLQAETGWWDYDFHSGGECKRLDLAIMFALYDVYIMLYGQQCNVMVLDEVDSRLDTAGVRSFVEIIQNDFAGTREDKPDSILIISHKKEMVDQFPNQIQVTLDSKRMSHIS